MMNLKEFLTQVAKYNLQFSMPTANIDKDYKYANGCGAKGGVKFPKTMWGLNIEAACQVHDIDWTNAKSLDDLILGTEMMLRNLKHIIDAESGFIMKRARRWRAAKYITEIDLIGTPSEAVKRGFIQADHPVNKPNHAGILGILDIIIDKMHDKFINKEQ